MTNVFARFVKDESGATAIEYGLIAALIAVALIAILGTLSTSLSGTFQKVATKLNAANAETGAQVLTVNGAPALMLYLDGVLDQVQMIAVENGRIAALYLVRNPDKLRTFLDHQRTQA